MNEYHLEPKPGSLEPQKHHMTLPAEHLTSVDPASDNLDKDRSV